MSPPLPYTSHTLHCLCEHLRSTSISGDASIKESGRVTGELLQVWCKRTIHIYIIDWILTADVLKGDGDWNLFCICLMSIFTRQKWVFTPTEFQYSRKIVPAVSLNSYNCSSTSNLIGYVRIWLSVFTNKCTSYTTLNPEKVKRSHFELIPNNAQTTLMIYKMHEEIHCSKTFKGILIITV